MHSLYYSYTIANVSPLLLDLDTDLLIRESDLATLKSSPRSGPYNSRLQSSSSIAHKSDTSHTFKATDHFKKNHLLVFSAK